MLYCRVDEDYDIIVEIFPINPVLKNSAASTCFCFATAMPSPQSLASIPHVQSEDELIIAQDTPSVTEENNSVKK